MGKWHSRSFSLAFVIQPVKEKEKTEYKPALLGSEIDLVSNTARSEWFG